MTMRNQKLDKAQEGKTLEGEIEQTLVTIVNFSLDLVESEAVLTSS